MSLSSYRSQIGSIDRQIVELLVQRINVARKIAQLKRQRRLPIFDPQRERAIKDKLRLLAAKHQLRTGVVDDIFQIIIDYTKQEMKRCETTPSETRKLRRKE